jgi:toxin-antitoxin system PIN domain toxin
LIAADTKILVYAHRADSEWHEPAFDCIRNLAEGRVSWGIPWPCVHEFLSIVTHPKIYDPPSSLDNALDQIDAWLESPVAFLIAEAESHWNILKELLAVGQIRGPMVHDARIAAICIGHGVTELWTADRDFSRFPVLATRNPLLA